jgi:hypothetical protein
VLAAQAPAYRMAAATSTARVAQLAAALGVTGSVATYTTGWGVDGGSRTLRVQRLGGLPWTLSSAAGSASAVSGCAVAGPAVTAGSGSATNPGPASAGPPASPGPGTPTAGTLPAVGPPPSCPPATIVRGLPSATDATRLAQAALIRAGLDLAGASVHVYGGSSEWEVTIEPAVGRVAVVGSAWSLSVGANGTILSGSGYLADPGNVGDYPLAGVSAGVQRLRQGAPWTVYGGPGPLPMMGAAAASGTGATTGAPSAGENGSAMACPPGAECAVPASPPRTLACPSSSCVRAGEPPAAVRTITGVHLALGWWSAADPAVQVAWLLPVYVFELDNGQTIPVLAVSDRYLTQPASATTTATTPASGPTAKPVPVPPTAPATAPSAVPGRPAAGHPVTSSARSASELVR